jgi:anti-anti-sigma factor
MQDVQHIGSFGLSALVQIARQVRLAGGRLRLDGVPPRVSKALKRQKLDWLLSLDGFSPEAGDEVLYQAGMDGDLSWGVLVLSRRLDVECVEQLRHAVDPDQLDVTHLVLDLSHTDYLDSAGIAWLHAVSKSLKGRGAEVRIMGMRQSLLRILEVSGYGRDFFNRNSDSLGAPDYTWYPTQQIRNIG